MSSTMILIGTCTINAILIWIKRHLLFCQQPCPICIFLISSITQIEECRIFTHLHHGIIIGSKKIKLRSGRITLIKGISHLTKICSNGYRHHSMSLVTTTFLILSNLFTATQRICKCSLNQLTYITITYTIIEIIHHIVHHVIIFSQDANSHIRTHIYQIPV